MPYIGRGIETLSDRVVLDSLTASATASYTLQLNSVNFVPSSASSLTVSLNGVIQKPDSSYTVSGSTLTFSSALTSSDSIDFIIAERGITLQTPSAGSVNTDQLASNAVTAAKINDGEITNAKISSTAGIATTKLGTGALIQMQYHVRTNTQTISAGSTATVQSVSITPTSTSSKILLHVKYNGYSYSGSSDLNYGEKFLRDSTVIKSNAEMWYKAGTTNEFVNSSATWVDTPSSTSSITYNYQIVTTSGRGNFEYGRGGANTTFYAMEIAG